MNRNEALAISLRNKKELLESNNAKFNKEIEKLAAENKDFAAIGDKFKALGARLAMTALSGDKQKLDAIKAEMDCLASEKYALIEKSGIKRPDYSCEKCKDTGYLNGEICDCVKAAAGEIMLNELYDKTPAKDCTFESFDLSFYKDENAKRRMQSIFAFSKDFADGFNAKNGKNLLFMGNTGLGKTHLSLAIANCVVKMGYSVLYSPAYNLFAEIETEHFSIHTNEKYDEAVNCDLLIIDDLGGEFVSPYVQSVVYNIINTRINASKSTIINTNLSMTQIEEKYTPRVSSRLIGEYTAKAFLGQDIRQLKKLGQKEG